MVGRLGRPKESIISADPIDFRSEHHCDSSRSWIDRILFAPLPRALDTSSESQQRLTKLALRATAGTMKNNRID
jgi:hypothetical protein